MTEKSKTKKQFRFSRIEKLYQEQSRILSRIPVKMQSSMLIQACKCALTKKIISVIYSKISQLRKEIFYEEKIVEWVFDSFPHPAFRFTIIVCRGFPCCHEVWVVRS